MTDDVAGPDGSALSEGLGPAVPERTEWLHLKGYGYAPGNYMSKCHRCQHVVSGLDKRAITCRSCAELAELREKVGLAYGYLLCVNNEPGTPHQMPPQRAAYEARKLLRDTMTHEERGIFINRVLPLVRGPNGQLTRSQRDD